MNQETIKALTVGLGLINPALGTIASLATGFLRADKQVSGTESGLPSKALEAMELVSAVAPLFQRAADGGNVTMDDVRASVASREKATADFDALIAAKGG